MGENGLDANQRAALMALTPRELPAQARPLSLPPKSAQKQIPRPADPAACELTCALQLTCISLPPPLLAHAFVTATGAISCKFMNDWH